MIIIDQISTDIKLSKLDFIWAVHSTNIFHSHLDMLLIF